LCAVALAQPPSPGAYGRPRLLAMLANPHVTESSGIAVSRRHERVLWTHNDSGDAARLYAFDLEGRDLGAWQVEGAVNRDWEDLASVQMDGQSWLVVSDTGDNLGWRAECALYLVPEPDVHEPAQGPRVAKGALTLRFRYEDGARDCEALAVDIPARTIYLIEKTSRPVSQVYALAWPQTQPAEVAVARKAGQAPISLATAADMSPDGLRLAVGALKAAVEFERAPGETWPQALARPPRPLPAPRRKQGESICYAWDTRTLYMTSEGSPAPLWVVPWR